MLFYLMAAASIAGNPANVPIDGSRHFLRPLEGRFARGRPTFPATGTFLSV
ncbi:hypothetical protein [Cohnella thermotolerans]|uniref:hypothetical protein n=1 Tax=Cohnella thermotolerans TaxID=329858 RepID=UPI000404A375|nr:hypothetical protein [Cohnella thermotolerans]